MDQSTNGTATPTALLALDNASNAPNLTLDHCVSQKWFNAPNAPVAALESEVGNPNAAVFGCMIEFRSG